MASQGYVTRDQKGSIVSHTFSHPSPRLETIDLLINLASSRRGRLLRHLAPADYVVWRDLASDPESMGDRAAITAITRPNSDPHSLIGLLKRAERDLTLRGYEQLRADAPERAAGAMHALGYRPIRPTRDGTLYFKPLR